ncbi:MAG: hypothetical protein ACYTFY_23375, partial [Planctomycetota bacterium]
MQKIIQSVIALLLCSGILLSSDNYTVLDLSFAEKAVDASIYKHKASARGKVEWGKDGEKSFVKFIGKGALIVPDNKVLQPEDKSWVLECEFRTK